jgi:hypothetical protein
MVTNRERFFKRHNIALSDSLSIQQVARLAGVPLAALMEIYRRGEGAYFNNRESVRVKGTFAKNPSLKEVPSSGRLSMAQWAMARVYSFVEKQKGTYYGADADIRRRYNIDI